ncbi:MAG: 30S ribosomal protein S16 [Patescibacteria group bacterium]|jgi:small subunit ribosomal protein S16|nr:30S ribosomal protein S16 [Patescibacteria group bacterium]|tara:strand:- start:481 stop:924 length:444 start_codon:yes stop_codon:yes gene_type:complete
MLAIRLQRIGKKNRPSYRVVVSEHKRDLYGKHNEILGNYDPVSEPKQINLKVDRIKHWLSVGAQPSATVQNLLVKENIIEDKKIKSWRPKVKKEKKEGDEKEPKAEAPKEEKSEDAKPKPEAKQEKPKDEKPAQEKKDEPAADESKK